MMKSLLGRTIKELGALLPRIEQLGGELERVGEAMMKCWNEQGKVLIAGNGGSAADAMHLAEELSVRFAKNRRALAAMALCDPAVITCAGNGFGVDSIFSRQIEALGNDGDVFVALSTSGNSANLVLAVEAAKAPGGTTASLLGKDE